ncbi:MAG: hypothetical protein V2J12_13345 [Gammaproteobacteria bacterium]|nr:hypothetical protein [Gammaproteobacteria bacterium]
MKAANLKTVPLDIAKGAQPVFFDQPATEAIYGMLIVMLEEICVLRDRIDTCEKLGEQGIPATTAAVEDFIASPEVEQEREARRKLLIERTLRPVRQLQEAAVVRAQHNYEKTARDIAEREI